MVYCWNVNQKMPMKSSPLFKKVSTLLKSSIFIAKMKRSILTQVVYLKRSRKVKKLMFKKHYNYRYIQEYEFSPSNTPLMQMQYYGKPLKKKRYQDLCSVFFVCKCMGMLQSDEDPEERRYPMELVALPATEDSWTRELSAADSCSEEDDQSCVDERAEKFIERFYEEIRRQKQEGALMLLN